MATRSAARVLQRYPETTCPYCHDTCSPSEDVSVCSGCLARHHDDCWSETSGCASCRAQVALVDARRRRVEPQPRLRRGTTPRRAGWFVTVAAFLTLLGTHVLFAPGIAIYDPSGISLNYIAYQAQKGRRTRWAIAALGVGLALIGVAKILEREAGWG